MKRLRLEEIHDKTKSMDFGMGFGSGVRKTDGENDVKGHKGHQVSMDLDVNNPYLLPGTLQGSQESLHSLSKALDANDPRYGIRPGTSHSQMDGHTLGQPNYAPSQLSNLAHTQTGESYIYTTSNKNDSPNGSTTSMAEELLSKAQGMAMSPPPPSSSRLPQAPELRIPSPPPAAIIKPENSNVPHDIPTELQPGERKDSYRLPPSIPMITKSHLDFEFNLTISTPDQTSQPQNAPQEMDPLKFDARPPPDASDYAGDTNTGISFRFSSASEDEENTVQLPPRKPIRDTLAPGGFDNRRLSMGFRPLPPDGSPDESAEERASRIRSFYKEYFDDQGGNDRQSFYQSGGYYGDATDEYVPTIQDDSAPIYDYSSGNYVIPGMQPFAEPLARRAMTPPPRMPQGYEGPRSQSSVSNRISPPGPRSYTSHSSRGPARRGPPRTPIPPPSPLKYIPTPSHLGEDAFASPISFAPKIRVQDIVTGRDSPSFRSGERPYSPSVPAHTPLASAFYELPTLLAPHTLRKSGTYTALDFAPPKKFKNEGTGSDSGSMRSGSSQLNPSNIHAIRAGAYRISRIPQEVVPLKDEIASQLRPTMDLSTRY